MQRNVNLCVTINTKCFSPSPDILHMFRASLYVHLSGSYLNVQSRRIRPARREENGGKCHIFIIVYSRIVTLVCVGVFFLFVFFFEEGLYTIYLSFPVCFF